ncbi:triacylglycerol lipase 1 [Citrus sinensis]|uniref:Triacylglycerol lipase 1 n=1 Tax=Citrus sinensis TaxID=2711 RepID=A0ACB8IEM1_CITSI|nr:triacylglycerol lipase 1 [Citrus sinensis]
MLEFWLFECGGGDAWFLDSTEESLGFILADYGFDVWVANVRGTHWSHGHVTLSEKSKGFWDWSWQDLALYDLAEMICFINLKTSSKIFLVGHSQGTIVSLAALTQPDVVEMVEAAALLSPISYLDHITAPLVRRMVSMHLDQGTFSQYDYGFFKNLRLYGQTKPPAFDLTRIPKSLPLWMSYGGNDALADVIDVQHTLNELQSTPELVYLENYGHMDFILSINGKEDLYNNMIGFFSSLGKSSSS